MTCGSYRQQSTVVFGIRLIVTLTMLFLMLYLRSEAFATGGVSDVVLSVPVSCNVSATYDSEHAAVVSSGTYRANIGTTTFKTLCNDSNGYSIYAIGYSNEEYGNTKLLAALGGVLVPTYDITTGTAENGATSNWAMKMTAVAGTYAPTIGTDSSGSFSSYHAVPTKYTKVATLNSNTDATIGSSVQSTYAVYIASNQPAGSYAGKVKYTLVYPNNKTPQDGPQDCPANRICYNPAVNGVVDTMGNQTLTASSTLWASNFQRPGYGFVGWSDKYDWVLNENDASGNGTGANAGYHIYGSSQIISLTTSKYTTNGLSLYAVWVESQGSLQGWTCPDDTTMPIGTVTALTDLRDNQTYAVAKLADSNCWMIENLRLNNQYTTGQNQNNPNVTNASLSQGYGGVFVGLAESETWATSSSADNSLYTANTASTTLNIITGSNLNSRFPRYNNDNTSNPVANMTGTNMRVYSYGNYYTWAAAKANTAALTSANTSNNALTSICPNGWILPIGAQTTVSKSFGALSVALGGPAGGAEANANTTPTGSTMTSRFRKYPNNFIYAGTLVTDNSGYYWSSTASSGTASYYLSLGSSFGPGTSARVRPYGLPIRCVAGT